MAKHATPLDAKLQAETMRENAEHRFSYLYRQINTVILTQTGNQTCDSLPVLLNDGYADATARRAVAYLSFLPPGM